MNAVSRRRVLAEALAFFIVILALLHTTFAHAFFVVFGARDLDRGRLFAAGVPILFGPEMNNGGHLPGGFFYLLLALPLKMGLGWRGAWELQIGLTALGAAATWLFLRRRFGFFAAWTGLASLMTSSGMVDNLRRFWNASFVPLFAILALIFCAEAFAGPAKRRGRAWRLMFLSCGLGMQIHFTISFILLVAIALQLFAEPLKLPALSRKESLSGLAVFLLTLLPYGLWLVCKRFSLPLGQPDLPFTGEGLHGISFEVRQPLLRLASEHFLPLLRVMPAGVFACVACAALRRTDGRRTPYETVFLVASAATLIPALTATPERYQLCFIAASSLWAGAAAARYERAPGRPICYLMTASVVAVANWRLMFSGLTAPMQFEPRAAAWLVLGGLALACVVFFGRASRLHVAAFVAVAALPVLISLRWDDASAIEKWGVATTFGDFEAMARDIHSRTGWSYDHARHRLFYVNNLVWVTPAYIYRDVEGEAVTARQKDARSIDGFFIGHLRPDESWAGTGGATKTWLLGKDLEPTLKIGLMTGGIAVGKARLHGTLVVAPYTVVDKDAYPDHFHNFGEGYSEEALPEPPPLAVSSEGRSCRVTFNDSPRKRPVYDIAADVRWASAGPGRWDIRVTLSGEPISQSLSSVSPDWTQQLSGPYFSYACEGKSRVVLLARTVGLADGNVLSGRSFLAPYVRRFQVRCTRPISGPSVGYESSVAYENVYEQRRLPGQRLLCAR